MADMWDAVEWQNLVPFPGPFAGYRDGPLSAWSAQAWAELGARTPLSITVLADARWEVFDSEAGNAGTDAVAAAMATRLDQHLWSWGYTNADNFPALVTSMRRKSITWSDRSLWPRPGVYLWAASPGITPGRTPPWCPVAPVAVQDRWKGGYDISTLYVDLAYSPTPPAPPPAPAPPPIPKETSITVQLLQIQEGNQGEEVRALQQLVNLRVGPLLLTDGIFGPKTTQGVRDFQSGAHLAVDGVAGVHTWGSLLGVPQ